MVRALRSNSGLASQLALYQTVAGDWRYVLKSRDKIAAVTPADIQRVATQYFTKSNRTVATLVKKAVSKTACGGSFGGGAMNGLRGIKQQGIVLTALAAGMFCLTLTAGAVEAPAGDPRTMTFKPVEFAPPEPLRTVLENGMVVYLLEDHELPLVNLSATMRTGGWLEPEDRIGLAALTGTVMRTGGGGGRTAEQIDEELEQFAIDIGIGMGRQSGSASLDVLSKDLARGLRIFAGLLRQPAFEPARVELAKLQTIEGIRRRQDNPGSIVSREFRQTTVR